MKLLQGIISSLLLQAPAALARASPVAHQLSHAASSEAYSLAARQPQDQAAPSVTGPSTLNTATTPASTSDDELQPTTTTTTTSASAPPTGPRNHNVAVGQNGTQFTPQSVKNIPIGDTLTFYFYPSNYSIVQSSFNEPCRPISRDGGIDQRPLFSGFCPTDSPAGVSYTKFVMTVTSTDTMWIYAVDGNVLSNGDKHNMCEKGMAMVVNPLPKEKAAGQNVKSYQRNAARLPKDDTKSVCPASVWGGELKTLSDKQKANWDSKHPIGGNPKNSTVFGASANSVNGTDSDSGVQQFQNGAERGFNSAKGNSLLAVVVLVRACVFGLGL